MFTDGLVEACDQDDEPFGEERLTSIARENRGAHAEDLKTLLMRAASEHCGGRFQDDASMIIVRAV
jgi:sigma-B regulation protein RsbU (phosphoserine phosphatase)